jgi:glycosyltransferase involved in cell wall biosynthesis
VHILFESHGLNEFGESEMFKAYKMVASATEYAKVSVVLPERWAPKVPSFSALGVNLITVPYDEWRYPFNSQLEYMNLLFAEQALKACRDILPEVDVMHKLNPNAVRYSSSVALSGVPLVIGPVGWSRLPPAWARRPAGFARNVLKSIDAARVGARYGRLGRMYEQATAIALVNEAAKYVFPQRLHAKCETTYEWIDTTAHPALEPPHNDTPVILYVGRLIPYKGIEYIIDALSRMLDVPWTFRLLGDGPLLENLKKRSVERGVQNRVEFLGRVPREEVPSYFQTADICCFPGLNESSGNVNVEAMAAARPLVVADWAGPQEIITDECGIKVAPSSEKDLVMGLEQALRRLLADEDLRVRMGKAGRARAESVYDVSRAMRRFRTLHERAAGGSRRMPGGGR